MPNEAQNAPKMNPIVTPQSRTCEPSIAATQNQSTAAKDENIDQLPAPNVGVTLKLITSISNWSDETHTRSACE
jgi:hypothetical protein